MIPVNELITKVNVRNIKSILSNVFLSQSSSGGATGTLIMKGLWDASTNAVPSNGDATVKQGFVYDNGNFSSTTLFGPDGNVILPYAQIRAKVDNPGPLLSDRDKWSVTYPVT